MALRSRKQVDVVAALIAGLAAGATYIVTMEIDNRLSGINEDDLKLLGRPFVADPDRAKPAGIPVHFGNSVALALAYARVAHDRLPGPPWLRGAVFATIENTALYPIAKLEGYHPGVRDGQIDRYWTLPAFLLSIPRHLTYGAVLGTLYDRIRRT